MRFTVAVEIDSTEAVSSTLSAAKKRSSTIRPAARRVWPTHPARHRAPGCLRSRYAGLRWWRPGAPVWKFRPVWRPSAGAHDPREFAGLAVLRSRKTVPVAPLYVFLVHQPQVRFVNQSHGLESVPFLVPKLVLRHPAATLRPPTASSDPMRSVSLPIDQKLCNRLFRHLESVRRLGTDSTTL